MHTSNESVVRMAPSETDSRTLSFAKKRPEIVFLCQILILYTVIVVSIYNLTTGKENSNLWTALLSSCLGYLLPNPTIKHKHVLPDFAQQ